MDDSTHDATSGTLLAAVGILNEDQTLGRYELLAPVGRGGMGIVWAAREAGKTELVAIKTLLPERSRDPRFARMLRAEAEMASRIDHPNVGAILDVGEDDGVLYLVLEWIDGDALSALLRACKAAGRAFPYRVAARIAAEVGRGLAAAHELRGEDGEPRGIIHRDVSPQNILVSCDGRAKIIDFGVAKAVECGDPTTESGFIKGKVAYLAPEQVAQLEVDARADVFALGTVLYEITTLEHPFRGPTDLATLLNIGSSSAVAAPGGAYPAELWSIVERALRSDPAERYATMAELAGDLERFAAADDETTVATFVASIAGERRARLAAEIERASTAAGERARRRRRGGGSRRARARRTRLAAAGLAGAILGAMGLYASERIVRPGDAGSEVPSTETSADQPAEPPPRAAPEPSLANAPPPALSEQARASAVPARPPARALATPASTVEPAPVETVRPAASSSPPPARFRTPGF